jgi:hypothetical protein
LFKSQTLYSNPTNIVNYAHFKKINYLFFIVTKILVSTGNPRSFAIKTEIINLDNDNLTCQDLEDYPLEIRSGVGSIIGSFPAICGGHGSGSSLNQCYRLVAGEWQQFATMNSRRYGAAGIVLGNSLMVFGGYEDPGSGRLQSTEIINEDGKVSQGPVMPIAIYYHANAAVNASTLIISGGSTNTNNQSPLTWYYNHVTQKFQPGPSLMKGREEHTSGTVVDKETNENIVVVAGGYNNGDVLDSTELLINGEWQQGTNHAKINTFILFLCFCMGVHSLR